MMLPLAFLQTPIAHRGLHNETRPENGLCAVRAAVDAGYGVEIDLQISADGQAMVFHDYELDRLTGQSGQIKRRNAADLGQIPLLGRDETIPTLVQVLDIVQGRVPVLIEIKEQSRVMGPVDGVLEGAVAHALETYTGPVAVMCFNPASVNAFGAVAPHIPRGFVTCSFTHPAWAPLGADRLAHLRAFGDFDTVGASFVSHNINDLSNDTVSALKARGVPVLCWTVTSDEDAAQAMKFADNITFEGYLP